MSLFNARGTAIERRLGSAGNINPFENPAVPLSSVALDSVFGAISKTDSGESVTSENAVILPTVFRCVGLLSTVIASCPIRTYRDPGKDEIYPAILDRGNSSMSMTQYELWELVVAHLCLWGNAYVRKIRNPLTDMIVDLQPIYPGRVKVSRDDDGNKIFEVKRVDFKTGNLLVSDPIVFTDFEIMHIPGLGYDGLQGLSPISMAARTIGTAMAGDRLAARFFAKGSVLSGIVKVKAPLADQQQADKIRNKWISKMGGTDNAAEVAVLDAETDFQPLTIDPDTMQFLESRRWETNEIARMFGIPPHLVGDVERSTSWGQGIETQNIGFVSYTISGWTGRIEQRITREVINIRKQYCEFDLDHLMRGSQAERYAAYTQSISAGWMTRNEVRERENMVPLSGLSEPILALNMGPGDSLNSTPPGQQPQKPPPGVGGSPTEDT